MVQTLLPLLAVAVLVLAGRRATLHGNDATGHLLINGGVLLIFLSYPSITQSVFRFFQTKVFDGDYGTFLIADMSVDVSSEAYRGMVAFAIAAVVIWPFGVPIAITLLLWRSRAPLLEIRRRETILRGVYDLDRWEAHVAAKRAGLTLGRSTGEDLKDPRDEVELVVEGYLWSLTESYRGRVFYFEVIEYVLQKLTLVGLLVFYQPGTLEQLVLGLIVSYIYMSLCCFLTPFGSYTDNMMAIVTQFSLFITLLSSVIVGHGPPDVSTAVQTILIIATLSPFGLGFLLTVVMLLNELELDPFGELTRPLARRIQTIVEQPIVQRIRRLSSLSSRCAASLPPSAAAALAAATAAEEDASTSQGVDETRASSSEKVRRCTLGPKKVRRRKSCFDEEPSALSESSLEAPPSLRLSSRCSTRSRNDDSHEVRPAPEVSPAPLPAPGQRLALNDSFKSQAAADGRGQRRVLGSCGTEEPQAADSQVVQVL